MYLPSFPPLLSIVFQSRGNKCFQSSLQYHFIFMCAWLIVSPTREEHAFFSACLPSIAENRLSFLRQTDLTYLREKGHKCFLSRAYVHQDTFLEDCSSTVHLFSEFVHENIFMYPFSVTLPPFRSCMCTRERALSPATNTLTKEEKSLVTESYSVSTEK